MEIKTKGLLGRYVKIVCIILGSLFLSFGFVFLFKFDDIYNYIVNSAMEFHPDSEPFKAWRINDPPLVLDYYLFNWTNADQLHNKSVKPHFEEIGPYRFLEVKEKVNITWHENNTISYRYVKRYHHHGGKSLKDKVTTINPVLISGAYKTRFLGFIQKFPLSVVFGSQSLFITKTVEELLFEGYSDTLLSLLGAVNANIPDKFGFFYKRNNTVSPNIVEMFTGRNESFGRLLSSDFTQHSGFYEGACGDIRGSAGEFFPMDIEPTFIEVYSPELCKYAHLEYEGNVTVKGINAYKFGSRSLFDNGTLNPENACFCNGVCTPTGVQNVSSCRGNSPTFLSLPHFYNADPYYLSLLDGLHPVKEKHELQISLEPKSSVALDIALRMQINMLLQPIDGFAVLRDVPKVFVPLFYFDQTVTLSDEVLDKIKLLQDLPDHSKIISCGFIILGSICLGISILMFVFVRGQKKDIPTISVKKIPAYECVPLKPN